MQSISFSPASASLGSDRRVLWLGGAQWAGKTTTAFLLCARYPLIRYAYDYHDARAHADRTRANPARYPDRHAWIAADDGGDRDANWVRREPHEMVESTRRTFAERFSMVLDDLAAMPSGVTVLAEGWGLRPEKVAPLIESPRQAIFLVPTEEFRQHQLATMPRARSFPVKGVSDPERAQRNRVERDRLLADDVVEQAGRLGLRVVHVDGKRDADQMVALVEEHFKPFLPTWIY
jgi:hypothetical protein